MRIPGTKIYRAFGELDRFSDEQCERFLAAAMRPTTRRVLRWVVCGGVGLAAFVACVLGMVLFDTLMPRGQRISENALLVLVLTPTVVGVFAVALMRDVLLRRRMRCVINNRSSCTGCGYMLLGLPVTAASTVACPECGAVSEVDPAMGELGVAADGVRTFRPKKQVNESLVWNPRWTKGLLRAAKLTMYGLLLLALAGGGFVAWRFAAAENDAAAAKRMLDPVGALKRHVASVQMKGGMISEVNAAELMDAAMGEYDAVCGQLMGENATRVAEIIKAAPYLGFSVDFGYVGATFDPSGIVKEELDQARRDFEFRRMLAELALERMRKSGMLERVDGIHRLSRYEPWFSQDLVEGLNRLDADDLRNLMKLPKLQAVRIAEAVRRGEPAEAFGAFDSGMAMAGMMRGGPMAAGFLVAVEAEIVLMGAVMPLLAAADEGQLQKLAEIVEGAGRGVLIEDVLDGYRIRYQQDIYQVFADAEATRWGVLSMARKQGMEMGVKQWWQAAALGRLDDNLLEIDTAVDGAKMASRLRPVERSGDGNGQVSRRGLFALREMNPSSVVRAVIARDDKVMLMRDGLRVLIAIERHKRARGEYPVRLESLVPGWLAVLPLDPWSGEPFVYRRLIEAVADGRGFVLYSIGANKVDDGGVDRGWSAIDGRWNYDLPRKAEGDFVFGEAPTDDGAKRGR